MRVGRYFEDREFGMVPTTARPGLGALCALFLDPMRAAFGVCVVRSGYRSAPYNREVGGAADSRHVYDRHPLEPAADVTFAGGSPAEWAALGRRLSSTHGRGGVGEYRGHVHVDAGPRRTWSG